MRPADGSWPLSDLELLELQAELSMDDRRRLARTCGVLIASSGAGQLIFIGSGIPAPLAPALTAAANSSPIAARPDEEPTALAACRTILARFCAPLACSAGPSYLIEPSVHAQTRALLVRSDTPMTQRPPLCNPGNWEPDEWDKLLDGTLGPWAMAMVDERVVSLCHTPARMTERAAECGVWTDPHHRGRGYAGAVTAAWAQILHPSGRSLFYSTDRQNSASQQVAARLQLRLIGWTWRLASATAGPPDHRHPLSTRSG